MSEELDENVVDLLKRSAEQQGELLPVIKDQDGNILSGRHRKAAKSEWRESTVMVTDELDRLLKIIHFNVQRRPTQQETAGRLLQIAEILEGRGVQIDDICRQIAEIVPYSLRHIQRLLPDKYKHVEMKREIAKVVPQTQDMVECEACHMGTRSPQPFGKYERLCDRCFEKAVKYPRLFMREPEKPKTVKPAVKDKWEHRDARMKPQHSNMELALLSKLQAADLHAEVDREFCLQATTPDFYFPKQNLAIYVDGPVHRGKEERDSLLREKLTKRYGVHVLSIPYENFTQKEVERVFKLMLEEVR